MSSCSTFVVGHGVARGNYKYTNEEYSTFLIESADKAKCRNRDDKEYCGKIDELLNWMLLVLKSTKIKQRFFVFDIDKLFKKHNYNPTDAIMEKIWIDNISDLFFKSSLNALTSWHRKVYPDNDVIDINRLKKQITHVITHSITSSRVPSLSHYLIHHLGLSSNVRAIPLRFGGCQCGVTAIYLAHLIIQQNKNATVLCVCGDIFSGGTTNF